jgi:hypothetical protein
VGEPARTGAGRGEEEELTPRMDRSNPYVRMVAIGVGAAVVFGVEQGLAQPLYIAVPLAIVAYAATLISLGWVLSARAK